MTVRYAHCPSITIVALHHRKGDRDRASSMRLSHAAGWGNDAEDEKPRRKAHSQFCQEIAAGERIIASPALWVPDSRMGVRVEMPLAIVIDRPGTSSLPFWSPAPIPAADPTS